MNIYIYIILLHTHTYFLVCLPLPQKHCFPISASSVPQFVLQCSVGGGLLCSVETPISRTSMPVEGHSQSFGVRKKEGWASEK